MNLAGITKRAFPTEFQLSGVHLERFEIWERGFDEHDLGTQLHEVPFELQGNQRKLWREGWKASHVVSRMLKQKEAA